MGDRNGEGAILSNIGVAFADQQQFSRATEYYQQALTIYQSIGHRSSQAVVLSNLGTLHVDWHQLPVALDYYRRSLVMFQESKDRYGEEKMLRRIAETVNLTRSVSPPDDA
jgi:tetratricopeptide (TPR) repeat protein